jgi:hypothetical protein
MPLNSDDDSSIRVAPDSGEAGGTDTSFLASALGVSAKDIRDGKYSLLSLGRQAMGADTEEYRKAQDQLNSAQDTLNRALQARSTGLDPKYLALAAGLLNPGGGGGFFEGLGKGMQGYQSAAYEEDKRNREIAQQQLAVAQAKRNEIIQATQLGLNTASKLMPKMTAEQMQVQAMGMNPFSPEGIAKVNALIALRNATPGMKEAAAEAGVDVSDPAFQKSFADQQRLKRAEQAATPEAKDFAARTGISFIDPQFGAKFQEFLKRKPLEDIAVRLNLDLTKPEHFGVAQREYNREKSLTNVSPELKKYLESFNGDVTNPNDMAKAANLMSQAQGLDISSKQASIAASRAATQASLLSQTRTLQEVTENMRNGDMSAVTERARQFGVPVPNNIARYTGLTPKEAAAQRVKDMDSTREYVEKEVAPLTNSVDDDIRNLKRAKQLNDKLPTGTLQGKLIPGYNTYMSGLGNEFQEFQKLSNKTYAAQKIPGDHNISNADMKFYQNSTFGPDNLPGANKIIIESQLAQRMRDKDYNDFLNNYASVGGNIIDANREFKKYANANPIIVKDKNGNPMLNPNRMTYQQYFYAPRKNYDSQGREIP